MTKMLFIQHPEFVNIPVEFIEIDGLEIDLNSLLLGDKDPAYIETVISVLHASTIKIAIQITADCLAEAFIRAEEKVKFAEMDKWNDLKSLRVS